MESHERDYYTQPQFKGFAAQLLEEVIRADMSMHDAQLDAWNHFIRHKPRGQYIDENIVDGIPQSQYLFLEDLTMIFHARIIPTDTFWKRLKFAFFKRGGQSFTGPVTFSLCEQDDPKSIMFSIKVSRSKEGIVKASYGPADEQTNELLKRIKVQ